MRVAIKGCNIVDIERSEMRVGTLIWDGEEVVEVGPDVVPELRCDRVIDGRGLIAAPSFVDLYADFCEPGFEHREDILSGARAAAYGGFTKVFLTPEVSPVPDEGTVIRSILERAKAAEIEVEPCGALTRGLEGEGLAEMGEISECGVTFVSNGDRYVKDTGLLRRAMEYAGNFGLRVALFSQDPWLGRGAVHEGFVSLLRGLEGNPAEAEEVALARHVALCGLTRIPVHLVKVSSGKGVEMVRLAKRRGLNVTASAAVLSLVLNDEALLDFDTNAKVLPPLRSEADRRALVSALCDGTLDAVVSDHRPRASFEKEVEFDKALYGATTIEMVYPLLNGLVERGEVTLFQALRALTLGPRSIASMPGGALRKGVRADLVLLDPQAEWVVTENTLISRGKNTPFLGKRLKGQVVLTVCRGRIVVDRLEGSRG